MLVKYLADVCEIHIVVKITQWLSRETFQIVLCSCLIVILAFADLSQHVADTANRDYGIRRLILRE